MSVATAAVLRAVHAYASRSVLLSSVILWVPFYGHCCSLAITLSVLIAQVVGSQRWLASGATVPLRSQWGCVDTHPGTGGRGK